MTDILVKIEPREVAELWEILAPFVSAVAQRHPADFEPADVLADAAAGTIQLWLAWDCPKRAALAVCATEIKTGLDGKRRINVLFLTGRGRKRWQHFLRDIEAWAMLEGACGLKFSARPGWGRVFAALGYRATHVTLEKDLA